MAGTLSPLGEQVRREDHDRYLTFVFAPAPLRERLFVLAAFNQELARTAERVSEPLLGEMRLAWWRDAIEAMAGAGEPPDHPVTQAMAPLIGSGQLDPAALLELVEARRRDLDSEAFPDEAALKRYAGETAGAVNRLTAGLLGLEAEQRELAGDIGTAWGIIGQLRSFAAWRRRGRIWLPRAALEEAGLSRGRLMEGQGGADLSALAERLAGSAQRLLASARARHPRLTKGQGSPFLLGSLAQIYLKRLRLCRYDLEDPRLALLPPGRVFRLTLAAARRRW